jgi:KipI family sensor histidine kinase inhibitor
VADLTPTFHICDDWIHIGLPDREMVGAAQSALTASDRWTEIVPGLDSIAVQFDPALISPDDAAQLLRDRLDRMPAKPKNAHKIEIIPVCYADNLAPDREYVAKKLGITADSLPSWHASQVHRVAMLGFMPGFAYLESSGDIANIGRLSSPRQLVKAGSIGIIGRQSCIYSFDSPGGWPIIGRTPLRLFDAAKTQPALLSAGQRVRFEPISRDAFDNWPAAARP